MQSRAIPFVSGLLPPALGWAGVSVALLLAGGCDDLGKCDKEAAQTRVLVGSTVMYAGQAVMVQTCATGCHSSSATGAARLGAPKGLDFDVRPIASTTVSDVAEVRADGTTAKVSQATVDATALDGLRAHQRKVYDQRSEIWDQVKADMMPPTGVGQPFRDAMIGVLFSYASSGSCTRGAALSPVTKSDTQSVLRNWLACGAPVVETQNAGLPFVAESNNGDAGTAADAGGIQAAAYPGTVGDQYPVPECSAGTAGDGGTDAGTDGGGSTGAGSFAAMFAVIETSCNTCHGAAADAFQKGFKLQTPALAYATLLGADGKGGALASKCASTSKPYVTPGNADASYLLDKIGATKGTICGTLMPQGSALSAADIATIRAWIEAGAPAP